MSSRSITIAAPVDPALVISSIGSAMSAIAGAVTRFDRASARIASESPEDPIRDRVEQITAQHELSANAATVRTADEMLGTLIDTFA
jgi:flagellar hook protein FlgE